MRKYRSGTPAAALLVVLVAVAPAGADFNTTVTATLDGSNTLSPSEAVEINLGGGNTPGTSPSLNYTPGAVNWTQGGNPNQQNTLLPTDFTTFCIELTQDISPGSTYTYNLTALQDAPNPGTANTGGKGGMGAAKATEIAYLWGTFHSSIGTSGDKADDNAAAFQLAIWKIEYDWGDSSLDASTVFFTSGNFQASSLNGDADPINTAISWLQQLENGKNLTFDNNLVALTSSSYQDQVTEVATNPFANTVPVPSTLYLIGAGGLCLFGYGFMRRRVAVG